MQTSQSATKKKPPKLEQAQTGEVRCIDIKDIDLYEKNPRRSRNPAYERIKSSILANGLDQPLIVTRRPRCGRFVVHAGGNTRLQILKELHSVSEDPSFGLVNCIFVPWNSESTVLLAHLRENDLRGDLTFIDKAAAITALEELVKNESSAESLTVRELASNLRERGYAISAALITYMRYAVNVLLPVMPVALSEGLGRPQVAKIRQLERIASSIWVSRDVGSESEFSGIFSELCRRNDSPDWQLEPLRRAVEAEIAEAADTSVQEVRMEFEIAESGGSLANDIPEFVDLEEDEPKTCSSEKSKDSEPAATHQSVEISIAADRDHASATESQYVPAQAKGCDSFDTLRFQSFSAATAIAARYGMENLVLPLVDTGVGFLVADLPPETIVSNIDNEMRTAVSTMWWQLTAFSEILLAPKSIVEAHLMADSELRAMISGGKIQALFERVWVIDPGNVAERFWARLSAQDWKDWLVLAETHRELHQLSVSKEWPLWAETS
jgi:ParB family protein of integrating conjugative element (PFGI_1 class)